MPSHSSILACQNVLCPHNWRSWLKRWRQPKGIWLNKRWYCGLDCFEQGAASEFSQLNLKPERDRSIRYRLPLGLLMVSKGLLSREGMQEALKAQRESQKGRFGEWLLQLGIVTEEQLTAALGMQWGCPVFHLAQSPGFNECAEMIPLCVMETSRMTPVHFMPTSRKLYVAFSDGIDFSVLRAIEQVLDCSTQPCVISESEMATTYEVVRQMDRSLETQLECPDDFRDLAREVREWVETNRAEQVRAANCPGCFWVKIASPRAVGHLVFQFRNVLPLEVHS